MTDGCEVPEKLTERVLSLFKQAEYRRAILAYSIAAAVCVLASASGCIDPILC